MARAHHSTESFYTQNRLIFNFSLHLFQSLSFVRSPFPSSCAQDSNRKEKQKQKSNKSALKPMCVFAKLPEWIQECFRLLFCCWFSVFFLLVVDHRSLSRERIYFRFTSERLAFFLSFSFFFFEYVVINMNLYSSRLFDVPHSTAM